MIKRREDQYMFYRKQSQLMGVVALGLLSLCGCGKREFDSTEMEALGERLKEMAAFQYPLDDYFPEIPVTVSVPPTGELYHAGEDSFAPPGTPVHAIGNGIIRYSGKAKGYGWLMIIDHPDLNVYSLYGHLSPSRWKKRTGKVDQGELVGYLGEANEAGTMVSHIHFGMRIGQKADYLPLGNRRWLAGYTTCRPDLVGWFHPSEIIGETEPMREWKRYIQKREDIVIRPNLLVSDFKITSGKHNEKEDLDEVIRAEFGDDYRLADWNDIKTFRTRIKEWADSLGVAEGEENALLISYEGYRIWLGRQYYISRFNHNKPREFLMFDAIDNDLVCLGSWFGLNRHVLAVRR